MVMLKEGNRSRGRVGVAAVLALVALVVLPGCFRAVADTYVQEGHHSIIKKHYSDLIVWTWAAPGHCDKDLNGNGESGGPQDRGWCALRLIRSVACDQMEDGAVKNLCNSAAHDREWDDFNAAARDQTGPNADCLTVTVNPLRDNRYNWTTRELGGGCVEGRPDDS